MIKALFTTLLLISFFIGNSQNIVFNKQLQPQKITSTTPTCFYVRANKTELISYLHRIKGTYKYSIKNYHAITIPANKIYELSQQPFIKYIDYHLQKPTALNDSMRVKARVNQVHLGNAPLPQGYTGKGVIIGFIDDGIDYNHPDFQDTAGNTRVLAIWDQTKPFDTTLTPSAYGYGQLWDSAAINAGTCTSTDASAGHGTTVAGTACGNGFSTGTHAGAAPDSWVVMVKTNASATNWLGTVADAVDFMYKLADSLGMPCVINASVGDYYGSHDGRDVASQYIDSLIQAKRGRIMVAALGNSGALPPYHLQTNVDSDTSFTWFKYNAPGGGDAFPYGVVYLDAWADTADMKNVQFSMGMDQKVPVFKHRGQGPFRNAFDFLGTTVTDTIFSPIGNILGIVDYYSEIQGDILLLQVHMQSPDSNAYNFRFSSTGSGKFDVWDGEWLGLCDMLNAVPADTIFPDIVNYVSPDSAKTMVSAFQCLESVIAVANYNNIQNYIGYDLNPVAAGGTEGAIATTSSRGPTRDDRLKPDIAATGNLTFSPGPLATLATLISVAPYKLLPDGMHMRNGGTSMASPVVAGIGGLILERCPQTNWLEFKTLINTSAYTDSFTGSVWNMSFGFGKVSAFDAIIKTVYNPVLNGDTSICLGNTAQLFAPAGMQTYSWSTGDTTMNSTSDTAGLFWFTGIDAAGCKTDTSFINVNVNLLPGVALSGDTGICQGDVAQLLAPAGMQSYTWSTGDTTYFSASDSSGLFWFTGVDSSGCITDTSYISVNVNALPIVSIILDTNLFTATAPTALFYQWYFNGSPISGATFDTLTATTWGDYYVVVADANGCTNSSVTMPYTTAGIQEINGGQWEIFPNPFTNSISIILHNEGQIEIRNNIGELVYTTKSSMVISTSTWPTGIYHVIIRNENGNKLFKMIKI